MPGTLYLRLADDHARWITRAPDAFRRAERGALAAAAPEAAGQRVVVLVPASDVLLTEARLPHQTRRARQAVPFAVEEQLSDDVERLHFALAPKRNAEGAQPVAVVARDRMQAWNAQLDAAGIFPNAMLPESLALPWTEHEWTLLLDEAGALLRTGEARGYALQPEAVDTLLALALEQAGERRPVRLRLFDCRGDECAARVRAACEAAQLEIADESCQEGSMAVLAGLAARQPAIDLLQGDFSRREHLGKVWRPWRPAAVLVAVLVVLQVGLGVYHYFGLKRESARLGGEIEAIYRQAFPEAQNVTNPRLQMEQHLARLRGGGSGDAFVPLMAKSAPVLRAEAGLELGALRFKDGVLEVELTVSDFQAIDRLKQTLAGKGMQVELQNASARGGKTQGLLRLREAK